MPRKTKEVSKSDCDKFLNNPTLNPITNRKIQANGTTAKQIKKMCNQQGNTAATTMSKENCKTFTMNPEINPLTGRKIKPNGPTAKVLAKACIHVKSPVKSPPSIKEQANIFYNEIAKRKRVDNKQLVTPNKQVIFVDNGEYSDDEGWEYITTVVAYKGNVKYSYEFRWKPKKKNIVLHQIKLVEEEDAKRTFQILALADHDPDLEVTFRLLNSSSTPEVQILQEARMALIAGFMFFDKIFVPTDIATKGKKILNGEDFNEWFFEGPVETGW